jgi:hypothetical protein
VFRLLVRPGLEPGIQCVREDVLSAGCESLSKCVVALKPKVTASP